VSEAQPQKKSGGSVMSLMMPRMPRPAPRAPAKASGGTPSVWVLREGKAVEIEVKTGASNGRSTEITGGALKAGMEVITEALGTRQ
jgi:HlyD family secretion protein